MVMKRAFTMLELIMVIVVLGIVASIGSEIIVSMYSNYLRSRTINSLELQTEVTLEQIAKRLQYRIKESVIARNGESGTPSILSSSAVNESHNILEWIGYSNESFLGTPRPGWSGFIDLDHNDTNRTNRTLATSESNLTLAANVMSALTSNDINLSAARAAGLIFKGADYNLSSFGWGAATNTNGEAIILVSRQNDTTFHLEETPPDEIYEQYYLSHSAYAIVPIGDVANGDFNVTLRYNYQPWYNEESADGTASVLAEHASLFRFKQDDNVIRLKLCLHDANLTGIGDRIVICKEKVVY